MPTRCRTRNSTAAAANTRTALCERTVTPPSRTSTPTRNTSTASASTAASAQSRTPAKDTGPVVESRGPEDSMNRRQFLLSSSAGAAGVVLSRNVSWAQAPAQPAAPPVTRFEDLRRGVGIFIGQGGTIGYLINGD